MRRLFIALFLSVISCTLFATDLQTERITKIESRKRSLYVASGIFHNGAQKVDSKLMSIRHSFNKKDGVERVVFDFVSPKIPRIYATVSGKEKKIYLDLFDTELDKGIKSLGTSHYVETVNFFPLDNDTLSLEVLVKGNANAEIFFLENPGRLVIDLKK